MDSKIVGHGLLLFDELLEVWLAEGVEVVRDLHFLEEQVVFRSNQSKDCHYRVDNRNQDICNKQYSFLCRESKSKCLLQYLTDSVVTLIGLS